MLNIGKINELKVERKSDLGFMLTDGESEVLLHFAENNTGRDFENGSIVSVFLYYDKKHRVCATTNTPYATISKPGFVEVVEVISGTGVFVNINTLKDVLIGVDYLPYDFNLWPTVGDKLPVLLKDKRQTLLAKPLNKYEMMDYQNEEVKYALGEMVEGYVFHVSSEGVSIVTPDYKHIFVHKTMLRGKYHVGEAVNVKIVHIKDNLEYNGSLIKQKEEMIDPDKEIILNYLNSHNGQMKIDAKSQSEEVERILPLSRKAFKRALGGLYKDGLVYFEDGKTFLKKEA